MLFKISYTGTALQFKIDFICEIPETGMLNFTKLSPLETNSIVKNIKTLYNLGF